MAADKITLPPQPHPERLGQPLEWIVVALNCLCRKEGREGTCECACSRDIDASVMEIQHEHIDPNVPWYMKPSSLKSHSLKIVFFIWCEAMMAMLWDQPLCKVLYICVYIYLKKIFWPRHMACRILVPRPGIEPGPRHWKLGVLTTGPPGNSLCKFPKCFLY